MLLWLQLLLLPLLLCVLLWSFNLFLNSFLVRVLVTRVPAVLLLWTVAVVSSVSVIDFPPLVRGDEFLLHGDGEHVLLIRHHHVDKVNVEDWKDKDEFK